MPTVAKMIILTFFVWAICCVLAESSSESDTYETPLVKKICNPTVEGKVDIRFEVRFYFSNSSVLLDQLNLTFILLIFLSSKSAPFGLLSLRLVVKKQGLHCKC